MFYKGHLYKGQPVRAYGLLALRGPKTYHKSVLFIGGQA